MKKIKLYTYVIKSPKLVLFFCLLLAILSVWSAKRLRIGDLFTGMLPKNADSVQSYNYYKKYFGQLGYLIIVVDGENAKQAKKFARELTRKIEQLPTVYYVRSDADVDFFLERKWMFIDREDLIQMEKRLDNALELQKKGVSFIFNDLMDFADEKNLPDLEFNDILERYGKQWRSFANIKQSSSGGEGKGSYLLWIKSKDPLKSIEDKKEFIDQIKNIENKFKLQNEYKNIEVGYTGSYKTGIESVELIRKQIRKVSVIVTILLIAVIFIYFRKKVSLLLIGLPLMIGIIWTGGIVAFVLKDLNLLTSFAASILAGLGSDYGIYLLTRFYQEKNRGKNFEECCSLSFGNTGKATYASMLTTLVAFIGLLFSDFSALIELGLVGAIGLFMTYLATIIILPALLALTYKNKSETFISNVDLNVPSRFRVFIVEKVFSYRGAWGVVSMVAIFCVLSAFTLPSKMKIHFTKDLSSIKTPSNKLHSKVSSSIHATLSPTILMAKDPSQDGPLVQKIQELLKDKSKKRVFNNVIGFSRFIPWDQKEKKEILQRIKRKYEKIRLPQTQKREEFLKSIQTSFESHIVDEESIPIKVRKMFESPYESGIFHSYLFPSIGRVSEKDMKRYQKGITELKKLIDIDFYAADGSFLTADALKIVEKKAPRGLLFLFLCFTVILVFIIRPFNHAFLILFHLIGCMFLLSGILWIFKIPLNILNIGTIPIILGTGVDCFIHFSERLKENKEIKKTLYDELPPMSLACLTSIIGFGGLLLTSNEGLRSVGLVAVIGLGLTFLLCSFVFSRAISLFYMKQERS